MKKVCFFIVAVWLLPLGSFAQLSRLMSKYHEQKGVTVTQLDKSLYGLYQRENLPPEATEMLRQLDEVNLLNLNLNSCDPQFTEQVMTRFQEVLQHPNSYKLIKSRHDEEGKQLVYTRNKNGQVSDLVVWNQSPERLDIIELRGNIQTDKIGLLSRALNLKGLHSLATLSSNPDSYQSYKEEQSFSADQLSQYMQQMQQMLSQKFQEEWQDMMKAGKGIPGDHKEQADGFFDFFNTPDLPDPFSFFRNSDSLSNFFGGSNRIPEEWEELFQDGKIQQRMEKYFQSFGDGENVMSNSVQITEENGKTKIKIDSKNSDMTYVIDGQQAPKDNVQMPESILNVNIIPSREDVKKSYLFITSKEQLGEFVSFTQGVLTFKYNNQQYTYNLDKAHEPLLVIDGRLSADFDTDPSQILQIRPLSEIEKQVGYYPHAEVIINTK